MKILPVSIYQNILNSKVNNNITATKPKFKNELPHDTVQFTGGTQFLEFLVENVEKNSDKLLAEANVFLDVLESVTLKLKHLGFSFDREYNELNPVKSGKSYASKVARSQSFDVQDLLRGTVYLDNPYDLSLMFEHFLPEMRKRGYVLSHIDVPKKELLSHGYLEKAGEDLSETINITDFDVRLDPKYVEKFEGRLTRDFKYMYGRHQKSGYEDIQMRFVKMGDTSNNPHKHELIVLFGKNYAKAKHDESAYVYNFLRKFGELRLLNDTENTRKIDAYGDMIKTMFRNEVSKKLYMSAKNIDHNGIPDGNVPISFNETDITLFKNNMRSLKNAVDSYYKSRIREAQEPIRRFLQDDYEHDINIIHQIKIGLMKTIEKYQNG